MLATELIAAGVIGHLRTNSSQPMSRSRGRQLPPTTARGVGSHQVATPAFSRRCDKNLTKLRQRRESCQGGTNGIAGPSAAEFGRERKRRELAALVTSRLPITDARAAEPLTSELTTTPACHARPLEPSLSTLDNRSYVDHGTRGACRERVELPVAAEPALQTRPHGTPEPNDPPYCATRAPTGHPARDAPERPTTAPADGALVTRATHLRPR
jgi:hypothetical protein